MPYYKVQLTFLSTGRPLNVDTSADNWIRNLCCGTPDTRTFDLRKVTTNLFALEGQNKWVGLRKGISDIEFWAASFGSVGKEMAFEIITNSIEHLEDRVRIKTWNGSHLKLFENNEMGSPVPYRPTTTTWKDEGVLSLTLIQAPGFTSDPNLTNIADELSCIEPLDGVKAVIKSEGLSKFLRLKVGGGGLVAEDSLVNAENLKLWAIPGTDKYLFQASNEQFLGMYGNMVVALSDKPGILEAFEIIQNKDDFTRIRIKTFNGQFLQIVDGKLISVQATDEGSSTEWALGNPFIFSLSIVDAIVPDAWTTKAILDAAKVQAKVVMIGPYGGSGGSTWDMKGNIDTSTRLRKVRVEHGDVIDSISFEYQRKGVVYQYARKGSDGGTKSEFTLADDEYIKSISGHYMTYAGQQVLTRLTFTTNKRTIPTYGRYEGTTFNISVPRGGKVIGFHGRAGSVGQRFVHALGVYALEN